MTGFRRKLMASYLLLALLLVAGLYGYLYLDLERSIVAGTRQHLQDEVRVAALMAAKEIKELRRDAPELTTSLSKEIRARVTVVSGDGTVVADSEVPQGELSRLENHGNRPEIKEALRRGLGSEIRYSATLKMDMLYMAAPFADGGVIRLALPLSELELAKQRLMHTLYAALAVAVVVSLLLSYLLSRLNSRNLTTLAAGAARIGRGDFGTRIKVVSSDELGELAQVMNEMSHKIELQLDRISAEKGRLDAILDGMGEGVMVTDRDGVVTLVNPAFCSMFGAGDNILGRPLLEVSRHPELNDTCRAVIAEQRERRQELVLRNGAETLVHWVPLATEGRVGGAVAVFHDITQMKMVERLRRDFVANVSHELRTPVTVIKGYAETLLSDRLDTDPQKRERFLGIILNHSHRLSNLVRDLLVLSELESGEVALHPGQVDLEEAVRQALLLVEQRGEAKGVSLEYLSGEGPFRVLADRARLEQVLINLLDNAVKYSGAGGKVTVWAAAEGGLTRVFVRDTGIGIPVKDLPRLFERFYRVDEARSRDSGGTGLGLSIVKHIVHAQGGTVQVESVPGEGSVFSFTVPSFKG